MILTYTVETNKYTTIRQVLKNEFNISRRLISKLKKYQNILLNGKPMYIDKKLSIGDIIEIHIDFDEENTNIVPSKMDLNILYEDDSHLVINKPPKMAVHPSNLHYSNSLANGVRHYYNSKGINSKIHLVNRLDKDTSGIVIFAKNEYIQECLIKQMKDKTFHKEYIAILRGKLQDTFRNYRCINQ